MTTATTNIVITAKDSTAAAFASVNSNITGLASSAARLGTGLAAIGGGAVVASMTAFVKKTIDAQDELFKLSQKTGIAVESLAGLEFAAEQSGVELDKVAKATRQFSLLVAESANASSGAAAKLKQLGLEYKDLKDLSPEKQLLALADALSKFGKEDRAVALTATLGNRMADLIPLLSGGSKGLQDLIEQGKKLNPVTEESARNAERFNDQVNLLSKSVSALGREMVQGLIPSLTRVTDEMVKTTQQSGLLAGVMAGVKQLFVESFGNPKILGDVGNIRREILKTKDTIASLETKKDSIFFDKNALLHEQEKLQQLELDLKKAIDKSRETIIVNEQATQATKKFAIATDSTAKNTAKAASSNDRLTKSMNDQSRIASEHVKLLEIERKQRESMLAPYRQSAQAADERLQDMRQEIRALELSRTRQISLEQAIELTTIARLEEKRAITKNSAALEAINSEIAARRQMVTLIQSNDARAAGDRIRQSELGAYEQFSVQAARNIQTNLAFGIEQGFRDGFKSGVRGLLDGLINTVSSIISQVVSVKLLQSVGAGGLIGIGGGATTSALSIASLGSNAVSLMRGGFGLPGLLSSAGRFLPGSIGTFFGAMGGTGAAAASGASALWGASGLTGANALGAGFGAMLGPVAALGGVDIIGRMLAGDKKLGGAEMIPVIGGFLAAMFGRGPYKFRQQSLQGTVSSGGFEGDITNVFRSKGGLFMGNKHKSVTEQLTPEMQALFDSTIGGFFSAVRASSLNLGLDVGMVDKFTKEIQIKSEKGQKLTEEAITQLFEGLADDIAKAAMPAIDEFKKVGEKSIETIQRLSKEYSVLTDATRLLFGRSSVNARAFVSSFGINDRTKFLDQAGGADAFAANVAGFAANFLTKEQQIRPLIEDIVAERDRLGLSGLNTRAQVAAAVTSGRLNPEQYQFLIGRQEQINTVLMYFEDAENALNDTASAAANMARELNIRNADETEYGQRLNATIQAITQSITELEGISRSLQQTVNDINPLSLEQARSQIASGNFNASNLQQALSVLSGTSASGFSNVLDFRRARAANVSAIGALQSNVDYALLGERNRLTATIQEKEAFQAALARAASMYLSEVASFDVGGKVPRTGFALIHKNEQVVTASDSASFAQQIGELKTAIEVLVVANNKMNRRFDKWDAEGLPAERVA